MQISGSIREKCQTNFTRNEQTSKELPYQTQFEKSVLAFGCNLDISFWFENDLIILPSAVGIATGA